MQGRPALCRALLALTGTATQADLTGFGAADWQALDALAAEHRLRPLLHAQHRDNPAIPADLRREWQAAHRVQAMQAMVQRQDLGETARLLAEAGIEVLALKGGWLAWQAYPEAAQRPSHHSDDQRWLRNAGPGRLECCR